MAGASLDPVARRPSRPQGPPRESSAEPLLLEGGEEAVVELAVEERAKLGRGLPGDPLLGRLGEVATALGFGHGREGDRRVGRVGVEDRGGAGVVEPAEGDQAVDQDADEGLRGSVGGTSEIVRATAW